MEVMPWAAEELASARLPDQRLNRRLVRMVGDFSRLPGASVPQASGDWAATKAAYAFWRNPRVLPRMILQPHVESTLRRAAACDVLLAVQDSTKFNYTSLKQTRGLGYINPQSRGIMMHSMLAVSPTGTPLGMLGQWFWTRELEDLEKEKDRERPIEEKESFRWLEALAHVQRLVPRPQRLVVVGDAEADIFELFLAPRRPGCDLLVRAARLGRCVIHEARHLDEAVRQSPVRGTLTVEVARTDDREARTAVLTLRYLTLDARPPKNHPLRSQWEAQRLQVVLVEEEHPPADVEEPLVWFLLTTLPVGSFQEALTVVRYYTFRWRIERLHFVIKSGCQVETLQLEHGESLQNALATFTIVACRLLWLMHQSRETPDAPCDPILEQHEWQALHCFTHRTTAPPDQPPTLAQAVRMIARLGGHLGRKHDGPPGVKTLWRGMRRLHDIVCAWEVFCEEPSSDLKTDYG